MGENVSGKTQELPQNAYLDSPEEDHRLVYRSAWGLWSLTFVSRVLGVVRDVLMARFLFGWLLDGFVLGITVQNLFRRFMGEGTLGPVLVPRVVEKLKKANRVGANRLIRTALSRVVRYALVASLLVSAVFLIVGLVLKGDAGAKFRFMAWFLPYGPLIVGAAALAAGLNAYGYFSVPALGPVLFNVMLIGAVALYGVVGGGWLIALAAALGGGLSILVMLPAAEREGISLRPQFRDETGTTSEVLRNLIPVALAVAVLQINVLFDRVAADIFIAREGAVSVLYLSHRLMHLPLALFGINLATVFLPKLAATLADEGERTALKQLLSGVRMVLFLVVPSAMGLMAVSGAVSLFLFWGGRFALDEEAFDRVVYAVVMYSPGIVFYALATFVSRMYHARKDVRTPARYAAYAAVANIVLDVALVIVFEERYHLGEAGLALASSLSGLFFVSLLMSGLVPRAGVMGALWSMLGSGVAGGAVFAFLRFRGVQALADVLQKIMGASPPVSVGTFALTVLSLAGGLGASVVVLMAIFEGYLRAGSDYKTWDSALRIVLAAWPTAAFAYLVVRSITPDRFSLLIMAERAFAPVLLGAFAYWLLIGFTRVREYDELMTALRKPREPGATEG